MRPNAGRLSSADSSAHGEKRLGPNKRLDSWKAIGAYVKRDERTVRRWENEGLPVHRHVHAKKASIYAYTAEIDAWWSKGSTRPEVAEAVPPHHLQRDGLQPESATFPAVSARSDRRARYHDSARGPR